MKSCLNFLRPDHVFWSLGFRPFFLLAGIHAVLIIAVWISYFTQWSVLSWPGNPIYWHGHEMVFGFATAVVSGFLLTATQNWTGIRGVHGSALQVLVVLWLIPRIGLFVPGFHWPVALFSLIFYPALIFFLKPYLLNEKQKRNRIFVGLLSLLFVSELLFYLEQLRFSQNTARIGLYISIYVILTMITVIGGRVIPFFTTNAVPSAKIRTKKWMDIAALLSVLSLGFAHVIFEHSVVFKWICFVAFALHLVRWLSWDFLATLRKPILWILYLGYAWMILGFLLMGFGAIGIVPPSAALHALTAGAIGVMILGMISRVSLGHTGRPIEASRPIVIAYVLLLVSVLFRVFGPIFKPDLYSSSLVVSGAFWSAAFLLFCLQYASILTRPRRDGKPG